MSAAPDPQLTIDEMMARTTAVVGPPRSAYADAPAPKRSIDERFAEFHANNPHVYAELVKLAYRARARGVERIGIRMLWEVLRWQLLIETYRPAGDPFVLNDHYHSRYVRLLCREHPDLAPLFELRKLRS